MDWGAAARWGLALPIPGPPRALLSPGLCNGGLFPGPSHHRWVGGQRCHCNALHVCSLSCHCAGGSPETPRS